MPVERTLISLSQLGELLGVDPTRLIAVEMNRKAKTAQLVMEPEDAPCPDTTTK